MRPLVGVHRLEVARDAHDVEFVRDAVGACVAAVVIARFSFRLERVFFPRVHVAVSERTLPSSPSGEGKQIEKRERRDSPSMSLAARATLKAFPQDQFSDILRSLG